MSIFRDDPGRPLHVPDLARSVGSTVDADGTVACVVCETRILLAKADVVGLGYRCVPCSRRAELHELQSGAPDNSVNLHDGDRARLWADAGRYIGLGVPLIGLGIVLAMISPQLGLFVAGAGASALAIAWMRARAAR